MKTKRERIDEAYDEYKKKEKPFWLKYLEKTKPFWLKYAKKIKEIKEEKE